MAYRFHWSSARVLRRCGRYLGMIEESTEQLKRRLEDLRLEHRDMDHVICRLTESFPYDQLQLKRLKKRKLALKDQITALENVLVPDIIA